MTYYIFAQPPVHAHSQGGLNANITPTTVTFVHSLPLLPRKVYLEEGAGVVVDAESWDSCHCWYRCIASGNTKDAADTMAARSYPSALHELMNTRMRQLTKSRLVASLVELNLGVGASVNDETDSRTRPCVTFQSLLCGGGATVPLSLQASPFVVW